MEMNTPPPIRIVPPLLNSANPWATTLEDLKALFECPFTGAVTTRTTLLNGFAHDPSLHQYTFFNPSTHTSSSAQISAPASTDTGENASLNNLGYSPIDVEGYLEYIKTISASLPTPWSASKLFIVSVTGTPDEVAKCYTRIAALQAQVRMPLAMEVNLSCPNIPDAPPPAYSADALVPYLNAIAAAAAHEEARQQQQREWHPLPWGLKTPPYTHAGQFEMLASALRGAAPGSGACPVSFITATNTLGSCLVLEDDAATGGKKARLACSGIGGLAGAPLHPLALGNVRTLRLLLDRDPSTRHVAIVGVGGVEDAPGYHRMRAVGAVAVGVGTALGRKGMSVFTEIEAGLGGKW
ncbi:dihydroorotate dehydrogenase [Xylariaceae sp. FL0662B]|nr:dihydroorotate dehydrogenase [Xylariaceae sp. FL0662B]